jgi:hypothetical protein
LWSVDEPVNNKFTDEFADGQRTQKNLFSLHSAGTFIVEYNISPTEKSYIILLVIFFVRRYVG